MAQDVQARTRGLAGVLNSGAALAICAVLGRLGICYLFLRAALYHATQGFAQTTAGMTAVGIPFAGVLDVVAMVVCSVLSLAILFNVQPRWAALGLAGYTFAVSFSMYTPVIAFIRHIPAATLPPEQSVYFMKDMALGGSLLLLSCALARPGGKPGWSLF